MMRHRGARGALLRGDQRIADLRHGRQVPVAPRDQYRAFSTDNGRACRAHAGRR